MKRFVVAVLLAGSVSSASANTLTFDDLPGLADGQFAPINDGYGGLNWDNFYYVNAPNQPPGTWLGYDEAVASPPNVATNGGFVYTTASISSDYGPIHFDSAYVTQTVLGGSWFPTTFTGWRGDQAVYTRQFNEWPGDRDFVTFGWTDLTAVSMSSYAGFTALDDVTFRFAPEPEAWATTIVAGLGLLLAARRRRRADESASF
jgi:hypothetical protein